MRTMSFSALAKRCALRSQVCSARNRALACWAARSLRREREPRAFRARPKFAVNASSGTTVGGARLPPVRRAEALQWGWRTRAHRARAQRPRRQRGLYRAGRAAFVRTLAARQRVARAPRASALIDAAALALPVARTINARPMTPTSSAPPGPSRSCACSRNVTAVNVPSGSMPWRTVPRSASMKTAFESASHARLRHGVSQCHCLLPSARRHLLPEELVHLFLKQQDRARDREDQHVQADAQAADGRRSQSGSRAAQRG